MTKKIVFIVGSLRKGSFNRQLADAVKELIGDRALVDFLDYADIPFMNQDIQFPAPEAVARVRREIQAADGIWIFTPEYNHQIPGVLKNLLDWLSRPLEEGKFGSGTAVSGKAVTVSGAGGKLATAECRAHLDTLLTFMRMRVMKEGETGVSLPVDAFQTGKYEVSGEVKEQLSAQADAFLEFIGQ